MIRIVTIEDEINANEYLLSLLQKLAIPHELKGHHDSIKAAVNYFQNNNDYDLVFMDIQIADGISFEIFNHVSITKPIIFTTAYDDYAIDAFKVHSIDYLLKPIHIEDLRKSIDKYHLVIEQNEPPLTKTIYKMIDSLNKPRKNRCLVKKGGHFEYVNVEDIALVASEDSITFLYTFENKRYIYAKTIEQLFMELDPNDFFQINRSQVVNIRTVKEIHPFLNQRLKLKLSLLPVLDREYVVSRKRISAFKEWIDR